MVLALTQALRGLYFLQAAHSTVRYGPAETHVYAPVDTVRLIIAGCEYSGATTLAKAICRWAQSAMGGRFTFHDHWKIPEIACYPEGGIVVGHHIDDLIYGPRYFGYGGDGEPSDRRLV
jgi:hypothetical protein